MQMQNTISSEKHAAIFSLYKKWKDVFESKGLIIGQFSKNWVSKDLVSKGEGFDLKEHMFDNGVIQSAESVGYFNIPIIAFDFSKYIKYPYEVKNKDYYTKFISKCYFSCVKTVYDQWVNPDYEQLFSSSQDSILTNPMFFDLFIRNPSRFMNMLKYFNDGTLEENDILKYINKCESTLNANIGKIRQIIFNFVELVCGTNSLIESVEEIGLNFAKQFDGLIESVEIKPFSDYAYEQKGFLVDTGYSQKYFVGDFHNYEFIRTAFILNFKEEFKLSQEVKDKIANIFLTKVLYPYKTSFMNDEMSDSDFMTHVFQHFLLNTDAFKSSIKDMQKVIKERKCPAPLIFAIPSNRQFRKTCNFSKYIISKDNSPYYGKCPFTIDSKLTKEIALVIPHMWRAICKNPNSVQNFIPDMSDDLEMSF